MDENWVCGVVLLREDGAALLQLRDDKPEIQDPGIWVFPGGHIESGESAESGARREFMEETCYLCVKLQPLISFKGAEVGYDPDTRIEFFVGYYDGKQEIHCCEGQELRFVRRDDVESLPKRDYLTRVWDMALSKRRTT